MFFVFALLCGCGNTNSSSNVSQMVSVVSHNISSQNDTVLNNESVLSPVTDIISSEVSSIISTPESSKGNSSVLSVDESSDVSLDESQVAVSYPKIDTEGKKLVAFTFDDAPNDVTQKLIDLFYDNGAHGTLFVLGYMVNQKYHSVLKDALDKGIELGNHSYSHTTFTTAGWGASQIKNDLLLNQNIIKNITGYEMKITRLPELAGNDNVYEATEDLELPMIAASLKSGLLLTDWQNSSTPEEFIQHVNATVFDGAIYCCHNNENTYEAMKHIIPKLQEEGYAFVSISELFELRETTPPLCEQIREVEPDGNVVTHVDD